MLLKKLHKFSSCLISYKFFTIKLLHYLVIEKLLWFSPAVTFTQLLKKLKVNMMKQKNRYRHWWVVTGWPPLEDLIVARLKGGAGPSHWLNSVIKLVMEMQISATQFDSVSPKAHISSQNKFNWKETDCYYYIC